jgi:hypothetical protein
MSVSTAQETKIRGYRAQGSPEISAPGALRSVKKADAKKNAPERLPPSAADRTWGVDVSQRSKGRERRACQRQSSAA